MDREILFRGKRVDNGAWETGSFVGIRIGCSDEQTYIADKMTGYNTPVIPETVGQYTGINDKNGRRIFEGDIVTIPNSKKQGLPAVIRWSQFETRFEISRMGYQPLPLDPLFSRNGYYSRCEIVGNIHDNQELLEEKE